MLNIFAKAHLWSHALVLAVLFAAVYAPSQSHAQNILGPNTSQAKAKAKPNKKTSTTRKKTRYRKKKQQTKRTSASYKKPLKPQKYGSTLVFEPATGRILHHYNIDALTYPASLTKMMTAYVVFEAIQEGQATHTLTLQSNLRFSPYARSQPATRVGLKAGIDVTIDKAIRALIIRSANDFAVALAETISGSETAFVDRMNRTARRLGMSRTNFVNPHGLPNPHQVSTARDFAMLTSAIIRDFPQHADVFSNSTVKIRNLTLNTHNSLLKNFEGTDGMKTGFTCASGYNIVASATRGGRRLVVVVIGALTGSSRNTRAKALLSRAFDRLKGTAPTATLTTASIRTGPVKTAKIKIAPARTTTVPIPTRKNAAYKTTAGKTATANSTSAKIPPAKTKTAKKKSTKTAPAQAMPVDLMPSDNVTLASLPVPALQTSTTLDLSHKTRTWVCGNGPKPRKKRSKKKKRSSKKSKKKKK